MREFHFSRSCTALRKQQMLALLCASKCLHCFAQAAREWAQFTTGMSEVPEIAAALVDITSNYKGLMTRSEMQQ